MAALFAAAVVAVATNLPTVVVEASRVGKQPMDMARHVCHRPGGVAAGRVDRSGLAVTDFYGPIIREINERRHADRL